MLIDEYNKGTRFPQLLFWIGGVLLFAAGAVYSFFQKTDKVFIHGGTKTLELNGSNPSKQAVDNFITTLQTAVKYYYKNKYAVIDPTLTEEVQIHNYKWLREIEAISETDYEELLHNLKVRNLLN